MAWLPFYDWWKKDENQQGFWQPPGASNGDRVAVSLGETPRSIFRQILQRLKEYHDQNVGYGNLLVGVLIGENKQVKLRNYGRPNPARGLASIRQDILDFEKLVTSVETLIFKVQSIQPAYSSTKFHELFGLLDDDDYYKSVDDLRRFGFFMRNNPLFLDETAKYMFFKKVLTIKEYDVTAFHTTVELSDIQDWSKDVQNDVLRAVRDFKQNRSGNPTNQSGNAISQSGGNPASQSGGNPTSQSGTRNKKTSQSGGNPTSRSGGNPPTQSSGNPASQSGNPTSQSRTGKKRTSQSGNPTCQSGGNPTSQSGNPTNHGGNPTNQSTYEEPDGSIVFFRNCLGHVRLNNAADRYHDAKILVALEDDYRS